MNPVSTRVAASVPRLSVVSFQAPQVRSQLPAPHVQPVDHCAQMAQVQARSGGR